MAFGPLRLSHDEFYRLTLREFIELVEGYRYRDEIKFRYYGWHAHLLLNCWTKKGKTITVDKLCGRPKHSVIDQKEPAGKFYLDGKEHDRIREYFKNAKKNRRSQDPARA